MDMNYVASIFGKTNPLRFRRGTVVSVQSDYSCTVTVAGDTTQISDVRYLSGITPAINASVWLVTDGRDMFVLGHMASASTTGTMAPVAYRTTDFSVPINTDTAVPFQAVSGDFNNCWTATDPTKLTAPFTGRYMATANVLWQGQNNSYCAVFIKKGTQEIGRQDNTMSNKNHGFHLSVTSQPFTLTKGESISMFVHHDYNPSNNLLVSSGGVDHTGFFNALSLIHIGA